MKRILYCFLLLLAFPFSSLSGNATKLKAGHWHTEFQLRPGVNLPVDFFYQKDKRPILTIQNGEEQIHLSQITNKADSLFILFPAFDSELKLKVHSKTYITGAWFNRAKKDNYNIAFWSKQGPLSRYPVSDKVQKFNLEGKWEVTFDYSGEPEKAIGLFSHSNSIKRSTFNDIIDNKLYGTFLTETGDYRFLEGAIVNDSLYLSCFDGSHAFLFRAAFNNDTLWGDFHSGSHYKTNWYAIKNENFELTHPDSLTHLVDKGPLTFSLKDINGLDYSYPNDITKGKVVLLQIMGTWCPNCLDESNYLRSVYEKHKSQLEIIAITFETQKTLAEKQTKVSSYKDALKLNYTFLIGGDACKACATDLFPQLSEIISFPTLIFIDKTGDVRKIHTGFSGPGTGTYYEVFVKETNEFIEKLVNE